MTRFTEQQYRRRTALAMSVYIACMLLLWPFAREMAEPMFKLPLALAPVLPMLYVIGLMAKRVLHSDELEQRTHLIGLGVATATAAIIALVGGFLTLSKFLTLDAAAAILIWIFPLQMFSYGITRWWVARRYGSNGLCEDETDQAWLPKYAWSAIAALAAAVAAVWSSGYNDDFRTGVLTGMACGFAGMAAVLGARRWRRRQASVPE